MSDMKVEVDQKSNQYSELRFYYELQTNSQLQSDTIFSHRTNIITLTQGLLFVAFNGLVPVAQKQLVWLGGLIVITALGILLSILWIFYEQRNNLFFKSRSTILRDLEQRLADRGAEMGFDIPLFWTKVPDIVDEKAKWFQRISAQSVIRFWVPFAFAFGWIALLSTVMVSIFLTQTDPSGSGFELNLRIGNG